MQRGISIDQLTREIAGKVYKIHWRGRWMRRSAFWIDTYRALTMCDVSGYRISCSHWGLFSIDT